MEIADISSRIKGNPAFKKVPDDVIKFHLEDAQELVKSYNFNEEILGYATYLYTCHLLFIDVVSYNNRFKSTKAENGEYTKFDSANDDQYWNRFQLLLDEQGYSRTVSGFE